MSGTYFRRILVLFALQLRTALVTRCSEAAAVGRVMGNRRAGSSSRRRRPVDGSTPH